MGTTPSGPHARTSSRDERGASAVEYALLIGGIAAVLVVVIVLLGGSVQGLFSDTCSAISSSGSC